MIYAVSWERRLFACHGINWSEADAIYTACQRPYHVAKASCGNRWYAILEDNLKSWFDD